MIPSFVHATIEPVFQKKKDTNENESRWKETLKMKVLIEENTTIVPWMSVNNSKWSWSG